MNFSKLINFKGILIGASVFAIVIAMLGFSGKIPIFNKEANKKLTGVLNVWGTIPYTSMSGFVAMFNKMAKTYSINYKEVPYDEINDRLIQALADNIAPDLVIAPSEIAFENRRRIYLVSPQSISESFFRNSFIDASSILSVLPNGYLGIPLSIDPLVLYYNRDLLSSSGFIDPPKYWSDFYDYNKKITKGSNGNFPISTIAFGTYDNIPNITDIMLTMVMQQGQIPIAQTFANNKDGNKSIYYKVLFDQSVNDSGISPLNSALAFAKDFSDSQKDTYDWSAKSNNALNQFISGKLAFYIGFASEASYIQSANQKLYFDYTYIPQVSGSDNLATYGKLYTIFMLASSQNQNLAYSILTMFAKSGEFTDYLVSLTGGVGALKQDIVKFMSSGDQRSEIFGNSALFSKSFYDLHRKELELLMREAIRQVYNGEKTSVEASTEFSSKLESVYNN